MRKLNTKFFLFLIITLAVLAGAVFGLHRLQAGNIADALLWQANQAEKEGKLDRAAKYLGRYLEFARDDLDEREHLGMILSDPQMATTPQRRARARFVIEQVLAKDPQRHVLRERLCQTLIAGRLFDAAKEHLSYLEKNEARSAEVPYLLGLWHETQNESDRAIDAYRRALKTDPGKIEGYLRLAALLKQADFGKEPRYTAEIDKLVAAALEKGPQDAGVLSLAAQHAQEKGNLAAALRYLEDGLKQNPNEPRLYLALAQVHGQSGKRSEAIIRLQAGLQKVRKGQQFDLRWSLANHLIDDNRLDDARKTIAEIRESNAISADYLNARIEMSRGRWFEASRQFERIRPSLKNVKELAFQLDLYLGACYEQLEEPAQQLIAFQRAAEADPTSSAARRGMANARWALGQTGEALRIYQDLVDGAKDADESARRRIEYVRMLLQSPPQQTARDWRKVEQELTDIEKTLPKSLDIALLRAELAFVQGDKARAETLLHEAIKAHPNRHEPWLALISFSAGKDGAKQTKELMLQAEERFKDQVEFRLAQVRYWARYYDADAQAGLQRVLADLAKFAPREQSGLLQAMAEAHYWAHEYRDSARVLQIMLKSPLHAQDVRVRMQMLEVAILQDDDVQAQAILADIKRIESDGVDWSFGEAFRLIRTGRKTNKDALEKARHLLTVASAQRPNWHPIIQTRAELDELQGRPDQAIANYRRAIDLGSRDPKAMKQLLILLSQAQRFDEVEQVLARMQKQQGTTDELVRYYVAHSYNRHDFKKAEFLIKQVVANKSSNYRDHLWMGQILSTTGQSPEEAEKALRRAVELAPEQPETWVNLVRHLIGIGEHTAAHAEIERAAKALPDDRKELTLAQCAELRGFLKDAADHYEAAVKAAPVSARAHRAAADFHLRVGSFAHAEQLYRHIYEKIPLLTEEEKATARRGLALALVKQNRPLKAPEAIRLVGLTLDDRGLLVEGKIAEAFDEQLVQAKVLGSLNHHKLRLKAITLLEGLQQKNLLQADDQYFLAWLLAKQLPDPVVWAKTRNLVKALTLQYPKNARFLAYGARMHIQHKEYAEAEAMIERLKAVEKERKAIAGGFGSTELEAKLLETRGLGLQAVELLKKHAARPEAAPSRKLLVANLQGRLGNYREAIDLYEEVRNSKYYEKDVAATLALQREADAAAVAILRINKPSESLLTKHGEWQEQRRRVESILRDAIAKNAKDVPARMQLADLMELQGKYGEVEKLCREVLKENDTNLVALNNLAWLLGQKADQAAEALTLIERAIEKHGPRPELLDTRAIVHLNLGNTDKALRDLERVVNEAPTPTRLFHLGRVYEKSRNREQALAMLRQANEQGLTLHQLHPVEQAEYQRVTAELGKRQ